MEQLRHGGVFVANWANGSRAGSGMNLPEALVAADVAIDKLGVRQTPTSIRFDAEDLAALARIAEAEDRSIGYVVRRAVRSEIERAGKQEGRTQKTAGKINTPGGLKKWLGENPEYALCEDCGEVVGKSERCPCGDPAPE